MCKFNSLKISFDEIGNNFYIGADSELKNEFVLENNYFVTYM